MNKLHVLNLSFAPNWSQVTHGTPTKEKEKYIHLDVSDRISILLNSGCMLGPG